VPIGEEAMDALKEFCDGPRGEILLERQTDYLFPTRRGDREGWGMIALLLQSNRVRA
jgi:site-specific recombinase XerD